MMWASHALGTMLWWKFFGCRRQISAGFNVPLYIQEFGLHDGVHEQTSGIEVAQWKSD